MKKFGVIFQYELMNYIKNKGLSNWFILCYKVL